MGAKPNRQIGKLILKFLPFSGEVGWRVGGGWGVGVGFGARSGVKIVF